MIIYLFQIKLKIFGKDEVFKYVGQTTNFELRKKAHWKDLKNPIKEEDFFLNGKRHMLECAINERNRDQKADALKNELKQSLEKMRTEDFQMDIVYTAKDKKELDCAEKAWQFIIQPELNHRWNESNCYWIDCNICETYAFWGYPNTKPMNHNFNQKWHSPRLNNQFLTDDGFSRRRVFCYRKIKQKPCALIYERKMNIGYIPRNINHFGKNH